jgi:O-6-methylguanine DNA methyltransferase
MSRHSYCIFDTPLGTCGIGWRECDGSFVVTHFQLPEATVAATEARIARLTQENGPSEPPPAIADVIEKVRGHLAGTPCDFSVVPVDFNGAGDFERQVYDALRKIPAGQTMTYGGLARALSAPGAARAVGQALGRNPIPLIVPCHRVLAAGGKSGGFSAPGGRTTKAKLLALEGVLLPF